MAATVPDLLDASPIVFSTVFQPYGEVTTPSQCIRSGGLTSLHVQPGHESGCRRHHCLAKSEPCTGTGCSFDTLHR